MIPVAQETETGVDWRKSAACAGVDPELFYPIGRAYAASLFDVKQAKAVCSGCPVVDECRDSAIENGERWGIFGGVDFEDPAERNAAIAAYRKRRGLS